MQQFARTSLVRASAASTGDIVYDFMSFLGVEPTREIATCILMAILTDTGATSTRTPTRTRCAPRPT